MFKRQRLTITIKKDLIKKIDTQIDGARLRNRSHAIEFLLQNALPTSVSKALVLAGGPGLNMRPFTYELPKCLIPIKGRPILEHIINNLRSSGIREIMLLTGPHSDKIRSHFGDGAHFGIKIHYLEEAKASGTAVPIGKARDFLGEQAFIIYYADVLAEINIRELIDFHESQESVMTMAVSSIRKAGDWGVAHLEGNKIVNYIEKPGKETDSKIINAGIFIASPEIYRFIPKKSFSMLEKDVIPRLVKQKKLSGYIFSGKWFDISTPQIYAQAIRSWKRR